MLPVAVERLELEHAQPGAGGEVPGAPLTSRAGGFAGEGVCAVDSVDGFVSVPWQAATQTNATSNRFIRDFSQTSQKSEKVELTKKVCGYFADAVRGRAWPSIQSSTV